MSIHYSRGRNIHDAKPAQHQARDFDGFVQALDRDRAPRKDGAGYVCGPFNGSGRRCAAGALPRRWLAVDLDRIDPDELPRLHEWFAKFSGCAWATHSSTTEVPRERVIIELARDADRAEALAVGHMLAVDLEQEFGDGVLLDPSTFRAEQPVHVPPTQAQIRRFTGEPLSVRARSAPTEENPPPTEEAQKNSEVMLSFPVPLLLSSVGSAPWSIPPDTLPTETGQRNACLFRLARRVKAHFPGATHAELRAIVLQWHGLARPVIGTADFSVTLTDFLRGIEKVRQPFGSVMQSVLSTIDEDEALPAGLAGLGYGSAGNRLARICAALQAREGTAAFFLSARQAGDLVDVHFTDAAKMLSAFVYDGVLELVTRGAGNVASRCRFVWPAVAGGAA